MWLSGSAPGAGSQPTHAPATTMTRNTAGYLAGVGFDFAADGACGYLDLDPAFSAGGDVFSGDFCGCDFCGF